MPRHVLDFPAVERSPATKMRIAPSLLESSFIVVELEVARSKVESTRVCKQEEEEAEEYISSKTVLTRLNILRRWLSVIVLWFVARTDFICEALTPEIYRMLEIRLLTDIFSTTTAIQGKV